MRVRFPLTPPQRAQAFAVEDDAAQLTWRGLGVGDVSIAIDGRTVETTTTIDAGAFSLDGLAPATKFQAHIEGPRRRATIGFSTLAPPPGRPLAKIATISDLHLGGHRFGLLGMMQESDPTREPHALRCARAAVAEAQSWGAELLLIKGDLTHKTRPDHWDAFVTLLDDIEIPHAFILGNHDVEPKRGSVHANEALLDRGLARRRFHVHDLPGLRVILADGAVNHESHGRLGSLADQICTAAHDAPTPVLLALHFHLHRSAVPWFWPPGFPKHEADAMLANLETVSPATLITSGHSHRNRRYDHNAIPLTEVGSTKDYPGVWAGYAVHEHGIRQVVRRVAEPSCLEWTERTRKAVAGVWGLWSPGTLAQRCFSHTWPV